MGDIIRQRQPKKAAGFEATRHWVHKPKHRVAASSDQSIKLSAWDSMQPSKRVDVARINWKGLIYIQQEYGVYNPAPRLVKR